MNYRALTQSERALLGALSFNPTQSNVELSKLLKRKVSNVQYQRAKLEQEGSLHIRPAINAFRLGLDQFAVFFSTTSSDGDRLSRMKEVIVSHPSVSWFGSYVGDFNYGFTIQTMGVANLASILDELERQTGVSFIKRIISPRTRYLYFHRKILAPNLPSRKAADLNVSDRSVPIDALDEEILSHIAANNYRSIRDLARSLKQPAPKIIRRYNALISAKVIDGFIVEVPREALGLETYRILLETKNESQFFASRLEAFMEKHLHSIFLIETLGQFRYELGVELERPDQIQPFISELYSSFKTEIHEVKSLLEINNDTWRFFCGHSRTIGSGGLSPGH